MITEIKEVYKCEFCRKLYQIKRFAIQHERRCKKNPDNWRACHSCHHLTKKDWDIIIIDQFFGEYEETKSLLYCPKIKSFLYPPSVEDKGNYFDTIDDALNQPMPKECNKIEDYFI